MTSTSSSRAVDPVRTSLARRPPCRRRRFRLGKGQEYQAGLFEIRRRRDVEQPALSACPHLRHAVDRLGQPFARQESQRAGTLGHDDIAAGQKVHPPWVVQTVRHDVGIDSEVADREFRLGIGSCRQGGEEAEGGKGQGRSFHTTGVRSRQSAYKGCEAAGSTSQGREAFRRV
jgi:hypothetical protein